MVVMVVVVMIIYNNKELVLELLQEQLQKPQPLQALQLLQQHYNSITTTATAVHTTLYYTTLHYTTYQVLLHYTTLHYTTPHYTFLVLLQIIDTSF